MANYLAALRLILIRYLPAIAPIAKLYLDQLIALFFRQSRTALKCVLVTQKFILKQLTKVLNDGKPFVLSVELLFILPPKVSILQFILSEQVPLNREIN